MRITAKKAVTLLLMLESYLAFGFDKTYNFSPSDFSISNQEGVVSIIPRNESFVTAVNPPGSPNIPFYYHVFNTSYGCNEATLHCMVLDTLLLMSDVEVERISFSCSESDEFEGNLSQTSNQGNSSVYPDTLIRIYNGPMNGDDRIALFVSPFIYDIIERKLYIVTRMRVVYDEEENQPSITSNTATRQSGSDDFDYLIITADSLVNAFARLRDWKMTKGVRTRVVSLRTIEPNPYAEVTPIKIKTYINSCYQNNHIQMVLLGGAPEIVPSPLCRVVAGSTMRDIPSDYYYSCLGGRLDWNANQNNIIGELVGDEVNLVPFVSVSRLPIETGQQASTYIDKLLEYEMNPDREGNGIRMLLSGQFMSEYNLEGKSDAEIESERMYSSAFANKYPDINKNTFYDTSNSFGYYGADALLTPDNLYNTINNLRPHFMSMYSNGHINQWYFGDDFYHYIDLMQPNELSFDTIYASALLNNGTPMVITSASYYTANCSLGNTSLAESFLRHPEGGAIAYWGNVSLRIPYFEPNGYIGPSMAVCESFWRLLPSHCHFGEAVKMAKYERVPLGGDLSTSYDWLLKSMNALGDCELPIYTEEPHTFKRAVVNVTSEGLQAFYEDTCYMAVTSRLDSGYSYLSVDYVNQCTRLWGNNFQRYNLCLSKDNYMPLVIHTGRFTNEGEKCNLSLQNADFRSGTVNYLADDIYVGRDVDDGDLSGPVSVKDGGTLTLSSFGQVYIYSDFRCDKGGKLLINTSDITGIPD